MRKTLSASLEMYLKTILILAKNDQATGAVHAKDIAAELGVARPSVTGALRQLSEKKFIKYSPYESVSLTKSGRQVAQDVIRRYEVLRHFLKDVLGVPEADANGIACDMEHIVYGTAMDRLISFIEYLENCPRGRITWMNDKKGFCCIDDGAEIKDGSDQQTSRCTMTSRCS